MRAEFLVEPGKIGFQACRDRHGEDFRHLIGMYLPNDLFHSRIEVLPGFGHTEPFLALFRPALPPIMTLDWAENLHAPGQTLLKQGLGDSGGFLSAVDGREDLNIFRGHGGPRLGWGVGKSFFLWEVGLPLMRGCFPIGNRTQGVYNNTNSVFANQSVLLGLLFPRGAG